MSLEKQVSIDKIEIVEISIIQVREVTKILEDGIVLSSSYNRWTLSPGADLTGQEANVIAVANAIWTPEVIEAFQNSLTTGLPNAT